MAKFAVSLSALHELLHLPENCRIVFLTDSEFPHSFDVCVECPDFPEVEQVPRIKPMFEKREPVVLKDWGFPLDQNGR